MVVKLPLVLIVGILLIAVAPNVLAACCFTDTGCQSEIDQTTCQATYGTLFPDIPTTGALGWSDAECADEPLCTNFGCCCVDESNFLENVPEYTCIDQAATFYLGQSCSEVCSTAPPPESFTLSGQAFFEDGLHPDETIVSLFEEATLTTTEQTIFGSESYSFTLESDKYYSLEATADECTAQQPLFQIGQDTVLDVTVLCDGPAECSLDWQCTYPLVVDDVPCGQPECTLIDPDNCCNGDLDNCDAYTPPQPGFVVCPSESDECGNGIAEGIEQCDGSDLRGLTCSGLLGFTSGDLSCDDNCRYDTSTCTNCPTIPSECIQESQCGCSICEDEPICVEKNVCDEAPTGFVVDLISGTADADITWQTALEVGSECELALQDFTLSRCEELPGGGCGTTVFEEVLEKHDAAINYPIDFGFTDTNLDPETSYCWQIYATYYDLVNGVTQSEIVEVCLETGDAACMNGADGEICADDGDGNTQPFMCNEDNELEPMEPCAAHETCIGPDANGEVYCSDATICDVCTGSYGVYSHLNLLLYDVATVGGGLTDATCDIAPISGDAESPYCFLGSTPVSTAAYDSCSEITSCYDYRDESSCTANPCNNQLTSACAWQSPTGLDELGIGICVPQDPQLQDCTRCHNNPFSPGCYEELCELHSYQGDPSTACYYAARGLDEVTYQCVGSENVICSDYDTKEECVGDSDKRVDDIWGAFADITYPKDPLQNNPTSIGGTHLFFYDDEDYTSHDVFGRTTCQWHDLEEKCVKNADNYIEEVGTGIFVFEDDCKYLTEDQDRCLFDNEPPQTTLNLADPPIYAAGEGLSFSWSANDDTYTSEEVESRFSLEPTTTVTALLTAIPTAGTIDDPELTCENLGGICTSWCWYEQLEDGSFSETCLACDEQRDTSGKYDDLYWYATCDPAEGGLSTGEEIYPDVSFEEMQLRDLATGEFTIEYFSYDPARNFEPIQAEAITIDAIPPVPTLISIVDENFNIDEDTWFSSLTTEVVMIDDNDPITCINELRLNGNEETIDGSDTYLLTSGTQMNQFFNYLEDGLYIFTSSCSDSLGNEAIYEYEIYLEADKRITNPSPVGEIFNNVDIQISILTEKDASCKYKSIFDDDFLHPLDGGDDFQTDDGLTHYDTLDLTGQENTYHIYYVGCDFGNGETVEANLGDLIYFSIDTDPPETIMIDMATGENYAPTEPLEELTYDLQCSDYLDTLVFDSIELFFNNEVIEYCLGPDYGDTPPANPCTFETWPGVPQTLTFTDVDDITNTLYYQCMDSGDNVEELQYARLFLRDLSFAEPCIRVCNEEGVCEITGNCP